MLATSLAGPAIITNLDDVNLNHVLELMVGLLQVRRDYIIAQNFQVVSNSLSAS